MSPTETKAKIKKICKQRIDTDAAM